MQLSCSLAGPKTEVVRRASTYHEVICLSSRPISTRDESTSRKPERDDERANDWSAARPLEMFEQPMFP